MVEKEPTPPPRKPESVAARRLTPVLTITLPSTEELRNFEEKSQKPPTPVSEKKNRITGGQQHHLCQAEYFEDIPKYEKVISLVLVTIMRVAQEISGAQRTFKLFELK